MTKRYAQGNASGANTLLNALANFLTAGGWATVAEGSEGSGRRLHMSKAGVQVNLRSAQAETAVFPGQSNAFTGLGLNIADSYNAASVWYLQPGSVAGTGNATESVALPLQPGRAVYAYHLFDDGQDNITLIVEANENVWGYAGFGVSAEKVGSWSGGSYFYSMRRGQGLFASATVVASVPFSTIGTAFLRANVDSKSWGLLDLTPAGGGVGFEMQSTNRDSSEFPSTLSNLTARGISLLSGEAVLVPVHLLLKRDGAWSFAAKVPTIYSTTAAGKGFSVGSTYTVGADSFMLFNNFAVKK